MKQIRFNVFETNSSSTHSLTVFSEDEYKEYEKLTESDEYFNNNSWCTSTSKYVDRNIISFEQVLDILKNSKNEDDVKMYKIIEEATKGMTVEEALNASLPEVGNYDDVEDYLNDIGFKYGEDYYDNLEEDVNTYTTKSGETIYIVCRYGRNG